MSVCSRRFLAAALSIAVVNLVALRARAQDVRFRFDGQTPNEGFGTSIDGGGDVNMDGVPDVVVGAPMHVESGNVVGRVHVYSGADGSELLTIDAATAGTGLGSAVRFCGDVDLDGHDDLLVGFPTEQTYGAARVISGADGSQIWEWLGVKARDNFGSALDGVGDLNGDGFPELLVGSYTTNAKDVGSISVYSGKDGTELRRHTGGFDFGHFGIAVAGMGDADGDGVDDYVVGEGNAASNGTDSGTAYVYSGASGSLLRTIKGAAGDELGMAVDGCGDIDGDGATDFVVGAPLHEGGSAPTDSGSALVYSGATGQLLLEFDGPETGARFGGAVSGPGDVNGDGVPDLLLGSSMEDLPVGADVGRVRLYSGKNGFLLYPFELSADANAHFGAAVCGAGDTDGDGFPELFLSAPGQKTALGAGTGSAFLCGGNDLWLDLRPKPLLAGIPTQLFTHGLELNDLVADFLIDIDGSPMFVLLACGTADSSGNFRFVVATPVLMRGHTVTVQSFAVVTRGTRTPGVDSVPVVGTYQ
jgi:hypothetical protein